MSETTRRGFLTGCSAAIAGLAGTRFTSLAFAEQGGGFNQEALVVVQEAWAVALKWEALRWAEGLACSKAWEARVVAGKWFALEDNKAWEGKVAEDKWSALLVLRPVSCHVKENTVLSSFLLESFVEFLAVVWPPLVKLATSIMATLSWVKLVVTAGWANAPVLVVWP